MELDFNESKHLRYKLSVTQAKQIRKLYKDLYKELQNKIKLLNLSDTVTSNSELYLLKRLLKDIEKEYVNLNGNIQNLIKQNMEEVSKKVVEESAKYATSLGFVIGNGYYNLPTEIVNRVALGKLYEEGWSLSKIIWKQGRKISKDINSIIAKGIAQNKSSYEIAKDLEKYVNPSSVKPWDWSKVYPGTNKKIDYNAQRLARTMVSHAYEQSIIVTTKDNPFVKGIRWLTSNSHRTCEICVSRDNKIYKPEELPLDHPNGMCTFEPVIEDDMVEISNRIADWANGKYDYELDKYSKSLL